MKEKLKVIDYHQMHTQYCVQNETWSLLFYKLGIEIDEDGHVDRDFGYKQSRQLMIEEKLGCKIIRTDPDATDLTSTS